MVSPCVHDLKEIILNIKNGKDGIMKKAIVRWIIVLIVVIGIGPSNASAFLFDLGHNIIFDFDQRLFWYDSSFDPGFDDWDVTESWANDLEYAGFADWRLPTLEELQHLGQYEFDNGGTYNTAPFDNVGNNGAFYLSSTPTSEGDQRYAYSLMQDRTFETWPVACIWGVAVRDFSFFFRRGGTNEAFSNMIAEFSPDTTLTALSFDAQTNDAQTPEAVPTTPEPSSLLIFGLGFTGIAIFKRKKIGKH